MRLYLLALLFGACSLATHARTIYVLSVGICDYKSINDLRKTENDATDMAQLFATHTSHVTTLLGAQATRENILSRLQQLCSQAAEGDVLVFIFSGHGGKGGLCAYDTSSQKTMITYTEIQKVLQTCRANNKQLYIDACFSGGLREKKHQQTATAQSSFSDMQGIMLFLSSRTDEKSQENPFGRNGFFTQYLLLGLKGAADADRNRIVTAKELFDYVSHNVAQRTRNKQHPVMWGKFNDNMRLMNWNAAK